MKAAVIILGALCAIMAYALFQRGVTATGRIDELTTNQVALSNQIAEARTRLVLAEVTSAKAVSNLEWNLTRRTSDLNVVSNRLVQTHLLLQASQKEEQAVRAQLESRVARVAILESENASLTERIRRPGEYENAVKERDGLRRELAEVKRERDTLQTRLGAAQVEKEQMQGQLFDLEFLERQRRDAETAADIRRRMATMRAGASADPRTKLELQPDGTVRYVEIKR
jgi:chromosome segregation ATPase